MLVVSDRVCALFQAAILANVAIYADKYDDEFREFFPAVVGAVWHLLVGWGDKGRQSKYDVIITAAMKFLAQVVSRELHKSVFEVTFVGDLSCFRYYVSVVRCCTVIDRRSHLPVPLSRVSSLNVPSLPCDVVPLFTSMCPCYAIGM